jgi:hypothetical protein
VAPEQRQEFSDAVSNLAKLLDGWWVFLSYLLYINSTTD